MPIIKNIPFGKCENATVVLFGDGDVLVANGYDKETNDAYLIINSGKGKEPIGTPHPENKGKSKDDIDMEIVFHFTKTESIDVVIGMLKKAKTHLLKNLPPCKK